MNVLKVGKYVPAIKFKEEYAYILGHVYFASFLCMNVISEVYMRLHTAFCFDNNSCTGYGNLDFELQI